MIPNHQVLDPDKNKYFFCAGLMLVFFVLRIIVYIAPSLRALEFGFIALLFGLMPTALLKKTLGFQNLFGWLAASMATSLILMPMVLVVTGFTGTTFFYKNSLLFFYFTSALGITKLLIFTERESFQDLISLEGVDSLDYLIYLLILFFTCILTLINFKRVVPVWDAFTFWGLDAKYLFEFNKLRDSSFSATGNFAYTSFYPSFYSIIYDLYGKVVEQYGSWINTFINFVAMLLVYNRFSGTHALKRTFGFLVLLISSYGLLQPLFAFAMMADILCAFVVLVFVLILIYGDRSINKTMVYRFAILGLTLIALFFIKDQLKVVAFVLLGIWVVYDGKQFFAYLRSGTASYGWILLVSLLFISLLTAHYSYMQGILTIPGLAIDVQDSLSGGFSFTRTLDYLDDVILFFLEKSPILFILWVSCSIIGTLLLYKKNDKPTELVSLLLIMIGVFGLFVGGYMVQQKSLRSQSLARYSGIVAYIVPLILAYLPAKSRRCNKFWAILLTLIVSSFLFWKTANNYHLDKIKYQIVPGAYSEAEVFEWHVSLADEVIRRITPESLVLIADERDDKDVFSNGLLPSIYVRYFLMNLNTGGQYNGIQFENIFTFASQQSASYVLLLSYDRIFDYCPGQFQKDGNYLIRVTDTQLSNLTCDELAQLSELLDN